MFPKQKGKKETKDSTQKHLHYFQKNYGFVKLEEQMSVAKRKSVCFKKKITPHQLRCAVKKKKKSLLNFQKGLMMGKNVYNYNATKIFQQQCSITSNKTMW